jgi:hypothetical protein
LSDSQPVVSTIPPPLCSAAEFSRNFPELIKTSVGQDPLVIAELVVEASQYVENVCDRRFSPFTGHEWSERLYGIDPEEYGAQSDSPIDLYGSLGLSQAAAYGSDNLVRHFGLDQCAPHNPELWTYDITSITLSLTYGNTITVDPTSIEGPQKNDGHCRFRLGTFAPEGTTMTVVYSGGFTVAIPASLRSLCLYSTARLLMLRLEPGQRSELGYAEIDKLTTLMMATWARS